MTSEELRYLHKLIDVAHARGVIVYVSTFARTVADEAALIEALADVAGADHEVTYNRPSEGSPGRVGHVWWTVDMIRGRATVHNSTGGPGRYVEPSERTQVSREVPWTMPVTVAATPSTQEGWIERGPFD